MISTNKSVNKYHVCLCLTLEIFLASFMTFLCVLKSSFVILLDA